MNLSITTGSARHKRFLTVLEKFAKSAFFEVVYLGIPSGLRSSSGKSTKSSSRDSPVVSVRFPSNVPPGIKLLDFLLRFLEKLVF